MRLQAGHILAERALNKSAPLGISQRLMSSHVIVFPAFALLSPSREVRMEEPIPRLTYVLVFVCKQCGHDICMPFHTEDPEVEVHVTCKACGWKGTLRCARAVKVLCHDASNLGL